MSGDPPKLVVGTRLIAGDVRDVHRCPGQGHRRCAGGHRWLGETRATCRHSWTSMSGQISGESRHVIDAPNRGTVASRHPGAAGEKSSGASRRPALLPRRLGIPPWRVTGRSCARTARGSETAHAPRPATTKPPAWSALAGHPGSSLLRVSAVRLSCRSRRVRKAR